MTYVIQVKCLKPLDHDISTYTMGPERNPNNFYLNKEQKIRRHFSDRLDRERKEGKIYYYYYYYIKVHECAICSYTRKFAF